MKFETFNKLSTDEKLDVLFIIIATNLEASLGDTLKHILKQDVNDFAEEFQSEVQDRQNAIRELEIHYE